MGLLGRVRSDVRQAVHASRVLPYVGRFLPFGGWNAAVLLDEQVRLRPGSIALACGDVRFTFADLADASHRWARVLGERGVTPGDVIALMMDNRPEYVEVLVGASRIGATVACINTNATGKTLAHAVRVVSPRRVIVGSEHAAAVRAVESELGLREPHAVLVHEEASTPTDPASVNAALARVSSRPVAHRRPSGDELYTYLYTSGTTGLPKAARVTQARFLMASHGFGYVLHDAGPGDVIYAALPLYHGNAQWGAFGAGLATGATLALRRHFSARAFWDDIRAFGATRFMYIGELCRYLVNLPPRSNDRDHAVQIAVGNGLRKDVWSRFQARFGIPLIREFYGATESNVPLANLEGRPGMIGRLRAGQILIDCDATTGVATRDRRGRCRQLQEPGKTGLLVGRISRLAKFDGYADGAATEAKILRGVLDRGDAWFNTGDLLTLEEDGWVSFADRTGDTFRWKGENVSTNEVAEVLNGAPGVLESNVYGVTIPGTEGRAGMASLVVSEAFDWKRFGDYVETALPRYQRPIFVRLLEQMQLTGTLKHRKVDYRDEGYDPRRVTDRLYFLSKGGYVPLDAALFDDIVNARAAL